MKVTWKQVVGTVAILVLLFVGIMLEPFLWAYIFKAESMTCNGIMCRYTKTMQNVTMYCYKNGVPVDCPDQPVDTVEWK